MADLISRWIMTPLFFVIMFYFMYEHATLTSIHNDRIRKSQVFLTQLQDNRHNLSEHKRIMSALHRDIRFVHLVSGDNKMSSRMRESKLYDLIAQDITEYYCHTKTQLQNITRPREQPKGHLNSATCVVSIQPTFKYLIQGTDDNISQIMLLLQSEINHGLNALDVKIRSVKGHTDDLHDLSDLWVTAGVVFVIYFTLLQLALRQQHS